MITQVIIIWWLKYLCKFGWYWGVGGCCLRFSAYDANAFTSVDVVGGIAISWRFEEINVALEGDLPVEIAVKRALVNAHEPLLRCGLNADLMQSYQWGLIPFEAALMENNTQTRAEANKEDVYSCSACSKTLNGAAS